MRYDSYKKSGIEWVESIPEHWNIVRGKNVLELLNRPVLDDDDIITCFRDGEVTLRKNRREEGFTISLKEIGYQGIEPGDLVVHGMDGFAGAIGVSDSRGKATPVLNVMGSKENKRFLMYYLRALSYRDVFMSLSTGIRVRSCDLRWNKLAVLPLIIPPREEQDKIVEWLDEKVGRIDELVVEIKNSIQEYELLKEGTIKKVVTKGLNVSKKYKNSGLEWMGEVPVDWEMIPLKKLYSFEKGKNAALYTQGYIGEHIGEYPVYSGQTANDGVMGRIDSYDYDIDECLFTTTVGAKVMTPKILRGRFSLSQNCLIMKNQLNCSNRFVYYMLHPLFAYEKALIPSYMQPSLRMEDLRKYKLFLPPKDEQEKIADYLDDKIDKIDSIIREKEKLLLDLQIYKKSIVYEAVTGERKVY